MTRKRMSEKRHGMQENQRMRYMKRSRKQDFEVICGNEIDCLNGNNDELSITLQKQLSYSEIIFHTTQPNSGIE